MALSSGKRRNQEMSKKRQRRAVVNLENNRSLYKNDSTIGGNKLSRGASTRRAMNINSVY
jgi:hypothetical protein